MRDGPGATTRLPILVLTTESDSRQEESRARSRRDRMDGQAIRSRSACRDRSQGCSVSRVQRSRGLDRHVKLGTTQAARSSTSAAICLQQIEAGLTEIREGSSTDDTVNAVFRAVHSIKGGAGIFGFETLVEFAHVFETVLDAIRSGNSARRPTIVDVLLTPSDVLADLVDMSRSRRSRRRPDYGAECRAALEGADRRQTATDGGAGDGGAADFDDLDFTPVASTISTSRPRAAGDADYSISFRPKPEMLKKANEPLFMLRELRTARRAGARR